MSTLAVHPLADLIPPMTDEEYKALREDIEANGLHQPITLYEGKILDGRHRARACDELGIVPITRFYDGDSPAAFVISLNVKRRSLTTAQRLRIAVDALPALEAEAKERQRIHGGTAPGRPAEHFGTTVPECSEPTRARDTAAALVGLSGRTVGRMARVQEQAPDLAEKVWAGEVTPRAADDVLKAQRKSTPKEATVPVADAPLAQAVAPVATKEKGKAMSPQSRAFNSRTTYREDFTRAVQSLGVEMERLDPKLTERETIFTPTNVRAIAQDDEEFSGWLEALRKCRTSLSRFITGLECV